MKNDIEILTCFKESLLLVLIFILITNIYSSINFIFPWIYKYVYDSYIPTLNTKFFKTILFTIIAIIITRMLSSYFMYFTESKIKFSTLIRKYLFESLMQFEYSFFKKKTGGEIVSNIIPEIEIITDVLLNLLKCIIIVFQFIIFFFILFIIDKIIFLVFISIFILAAAISIIFVNKISQNSYKLSKLREKAYTFYYFIFNSIRDIKYYNLYDFQKSSIKKLSVKHNNLSITCSLNTIFLNTITSLLFSLGIIIASIIGFYKIKSGIYSFGMLLTVMLFSCIIINPMTELFKSITIIQKGWISINKVKSFFKYNKESESGIKIKKN